LYVTTWKGYDQKTIRRAQIPMARVFGRGKRYLSPDGTQQEIGCIRYLADEFLAQSTPLSTMRRRRQNPQTHALQQQQQQQQQQQPASEKRTAEMAKSPHAREGAAVQPRVPGRTISRRQALVAVAIVTAIVLGVVVVLRLVVWDENRTATKSGGAVSDSPNGGGNKVATPTVPAPTLTTARVVTKKGSFEVLETVPHDPTAFTQGLCTIMDANDGTLKLLEGTGMYGASQLRLLHVNGTVLSYQALDRTYFGEGIAHYRTTSTTAATTSIHVLQLTWQERVILEYSVTQEIQMSNDKASSSSSSSSTDTADTLSVPPPISNWTFASTTNEGWGITYVANGHYWIVSDGSHVLHFWNATTRQEFKRIPVRYQTASDTKPRRMKHLNELEWDPASQTVLANIWLKDAIVRIDPTSGFVLVIYDLKSLFPVRPRGTDVLNGIALVYDASWTTTTAAQQLGDVPTQNNTDQYWITGKYWPNMYRLRLTSSA
jgi:glutaminyl-peptide cyclotransferase